MSRFFPSGGQSTGASAWWSYQSKQNITKQQKKRSVSRVFWKKQKFRERVCPEKFVDNILECLLLPRTVAS